MAGSRAYTDEDAFIDLRHVHKWATQKLGAMFDDGKAEAAVVHLAERIARLEAELEEERAGAETPKALADAEDENRQLRDEVARLSQPVSDEEQVVMDVLNHHMPEEYHIESNRKAIAGEIVTAIHTCRLRISGDKTPVCAIHFEQVPLDTGACPISGDAPIKAPGGRSSEQGG
jgi:hypothetical protein